MKNKNLIAISGKSGSGKDLVARIIKFIIVQYEVHRQIYDKFDSTVDYRYQSIWEIHRFADKLKQIVSLLIGISREDLEKEEVKSSYLSNEWNLTAIAHSFTGSKKEFEDFLMKDINNRVNVSCQPIPINNTDYIFEYFEMVRRMTVRELLQKLGTNAMRDVIHPNIHVNALFTDFKDDFSLVQDQKVAEPILGDLLLLENLPAKKIIIPDMRFLNEFHSVQERGGITIRINRDYDKTNAKYLHPSETGLDDMKDEFDYTIDNNGTIEELIESVKLILKRLEII